MHRYKLLLIILIFSLLQSCAIGTLKFYPPINGYVFMNGSPVHEAEITLIVMKQERLGDNIIFKAYTSSNGHFSFPESSTFMLYGPHLPYSEQILLINYDGVTYIGLHGHRDFSIQAADEYVIEVTCDIKNTNKTHYIHELNGYETLTPTQWSKQFVEYLEEPGVVTTRKILMYKYYGLCITNR